MDHLKTSRLFCKRSSEGSDKKCVVLSPRNVRRIHKEQSKHVSQFVNEETKKIFGEIGPIEEILMTHFLTLGVEDDHGHLAGVITVHNHPNIASLPTWDYESWLNNLYGLYGPNSENTFWIHFLAFDAKYEMVFARPIIYYVFKYYRRTHYIFLILPPGVNKVDCLDLFAALVFPTDCKNRRRSQSLYQISRAAFMVAYKIRRAVEEDNDDLVPLIDLYSKRLVELYGNYYIAEILTRHKDSGRHIIVAEYEGSAVSVMILNEAVNYDVLTEEFELTPYNGLRKKTEEDYVELEAVSQLDIIQSTNDITESMDFDKNSKGFNASFEDEDDYLIEVADSESEYSLIFTSSDIFAYDEEEEEEERDSNAIEQSESQESQTSYEILQEMKHVKHYMEVDPRLTYLDMMDRLSRSIISTKSKTGIISKFFGKGNAFSIEVVASHPDHEISLPFILEAAFECFPDREFGIISKPSSSLVEDWMSSFNRVIERSTTTFPHDLYVCHKSAILCSLKCQIAQKKHVPEIYSLLSTLPTRAIVLSHLEIALEIENSPYQFFVFLCEGHVIGTAVISEEYNVDYIDAHYDISPYVPLNFFKSGTFGVLESMIISPMFHHVGKYFKRELHRISDYQVLFYKYKQSDRGTYKDRPIVSLLHWLQPILPRHIPEYDFKMLAEEGYQVNDTLLRRDHYALYLSTISQSSMQRVALNTRVVVVGCSNTAYAFLESLLLKQHNLNYRSNFNNVTLICSQGLHSKVPKKIKDLFLVQKNFMNEKYMDIINLKAFVNVVPGNLTEINRKEKYIVINEQTSLRYDLLFLMCGEKFQKPLQDYRMPFAENPENVFLINSAIDGNRAILKLKEFQRGDYRDEKVIVYGHFLQTYSCLSGLLQHGLPGSSIALVQPFPYSMNIDKKRRHNISIYNDPDIYTATMEYIEAEGIQVFSSFYFINWTYSSAENIVTQVKFESKHKMLEMTCQAIFFFYDKSINPRIYHVINKAGLVFDGRLVVDSNCRTNDERIYGAGTLTKYSRRYYAANLIHKYFNRVEIGAKLGQQIRNLLVPAYVKKSDPKHYGWNFHLDIRDRLVPKYEQPVMRYCRLTGGLFYLSIVKPGRRIPLESASSMENFGQVYITGSYRNLDNQGFFKLHFNEYSRVETITCLTKFPIDVKNIFCLWGKHEKLLNNLQLRFEMALITDFFEYFKQPWAYAIYHDRFDQLLNELNNVMTSSVGNEGECLITMIIEMYKQRKWQQLTAEQQEEIEGSFPNMIYPKIIEQKVLDFIQENLSYLPMYAHPVIVRNILEGFDKSPLFSK